MLSNLLGYYGVQLAGSLLPLMTVPYLARVLGPSGWGLALLYQALGLWLSILIEYGFNLSAARAVAEALSERQPVDEIIAAVTGAKLFLSALCLGVGGLLAWSLPLIGGHPSLLGWTALYTLALGFSPFWYFQGAGRIARAAGLEVAARAVAAAGTFLWVNGPNDSSRWMALQSLAAAAVTGIALVWMFREAGCGRLGTRSSWTALQDGLHMTFFRASTTLSSSVSLLVLGWLGLPSAAGLFGGADKVARAESAVLAPLSQVAYPRVSSLLARNPGAARRLARHTVAIAAGLAVLGATAAALLAPRIVRVAFGPEFAASTTTFRILQIGVPLAALRSAIGMNWLLPMRLEKSVGLFVLGGLGANIALAVQLGRLAGPSGIAAAAVLSELLVLLGCLLLACRTLPRAVASSVPLAGGQMECWR
jgi:polysaccharide transporter, PST family